MGSNGSLSLVCKVNVKVGYFLGYSFQVELTLCPVVFGLGSKDIHERNSWLPYRFVWGMSIVSMCLFVPLFFFWVLLVDLFVQVVARVCFQLASGARGLLSRLPSALLRKCLLVE